MKKQEENFRETLGSKAVEQRREMHLQPSPKSTMELFFLQKKPLFSGVLNYASAKQTKAGTLLKECGSGCH